MDRKVINSIKNLSLDMINEAGSGHPGICLGAAPILYTLFLKHLNFNPNDGNWINRDRFVMSAGHGSALLYSTLFFAGYPIEFNELKTFRKLGSRLTGHPELNPTIGVEATTGALGQGFATAVGMALGEEYLRHSIGEKIINHYTYVFVSDGDLMEGISYEAASFAGSLKLGKLIVLYDSNDISLDGTTKNVFDEDVLKRFESCGWHTQLVSNGGDIVSIDNALELAKKKLDKPSIIMVKTILGYGSERAGTKEAHANPLSEKDLESIKEKMSVNTVPFYISKESALYFRDRINERVNPIYNNWVTHYNETITLNSKIKDILVSIETNDIKVNLNDIKINFENDQKEELRITNSKLMDLISDMLPTFIGGSSDVSSSTKTYLTNGKDFEEKNRTGKNIRFGVRESLMASMLNGLSLMGLRSFGSTFLTFSDYMKPGIRFTSMMNLPVTYIFTHDSVSIGADGPTHQPVEQIGVLRSIPNMTVFRPADVTELVGSWNYIINNKIPASIIVTKDEMPKLDDCVADISKGAYIIKQEVGRLVGIIIATGSEVHKAIQVANELNRKGIGVRVVSMPSIELFNKTSREYRESLLPIGAKIIALEASNDSIWNEFVYNKKYLLTLNEFGKSGDKEDVLRYFEFDIDSLINKVENLLK